MPLTDRIGGHKGADRWGITASVLVQSEPSLHHAHYCAKIARKTPGIAACVGWLDATAPIPDIAALRAAGHCGFRLMLNRMRPEQLASPALQRCCQLAGQAGLSVDLLAPLDGFETVQKLVQSAPQTRFILNHAFTPDTSRAPAPDWSAAMQSLGRLPNLWNKLAGHMEKSHGQTSGLHQHLDVIFASFPIERLMFASNWPIIDLFGGAEGWLAVLNDYLHTHAATPSDLTAFFQGAATTAYTLPRLND